MSTISNHFTERWISVFELPNQNSSFNINFQGPSPATNQNHNNSLHLWGVLSVGEVPMSLENRYKYLSSSNNNKNENENNSNTTKMTTALEFYSDFTDAQDLAEIPIEFVILSFSSDINNNNHDDFPFSTDADLNLLLQGGKSKNNNTLLKTVTNKKRKQDNQPSSRLKQKTKRAGLVVTSSDDDDDDDNVNETTNSSQSTQFEDEAQQQNDDKSHRCLNNNNAEHFCIWKQSRKLSEALPSYYKVQANGDDGNSSRQPKQHRYGSYLATLREYFLDSTTAATSTSTSSTNNNNSSVRVSEDDANNNTATNQRTNIIFNPPPCFVYSSTIPPSERVLLPALPEMLHQNLLEFIKGGDDCFYEPTGNNLHNATCNNQETKNATTMSHQQNQSSINNTIDHDAKTELLQNYLRQYQQQQQNNNNNNNSNTVSESFIPGTSFPQQQHVQQLLNQNKPNNLQQQNAGFTSTLQHQHDLYSKQQQSILVQTLCQNQQEQPLSIGTNNSSSSSASSLPKPSMLIHNNVSSSATSLLALANANNNNNLVPATTTTSSSSLPIPRSTVKNNVPMTHRQQCRFSLHGLNALTPSTTVFQCYFYNLENSEFVPTLGKAASKSIASNSAASQLTFLRFDRMAKVESRSASQASILESLVRSLGLLFAGCVHMRSGELRIVDAARRALNDARVLHAKMKRDEAKKLESFCEILNRKKAKIADLERIVMQERTEKADLKKEVERLKALMLPNNNNNNNNTTELTQQRLNDNYDTDDEEEGGGGGSDVDLDNGHETKGRDVFADDDDDLFLSDKPIQGKRDRNQKDHERNSSNDKSDKKKRHLPEEGQEDPNNNNNKNNRKVQQQSSPPSNRNKDNKKESSGRFLMNNI